MRKFSVLTTIICLTVTFSMCRKAEPLSDEDYDERLSGGMATIFDETSKAFSHAVPGLNAQDELADNVFGLDGSKDATITGGCAVIARYK